jgi:choline dehydrogenase-like flavoprotein
MRTVETDIAIVGSGVCGLLAAWQPLQAGLRVAMLERGALKSHSEQLADGDWEADVPGARHNVETAPGTRPYPWSYVYGVGGSTLHWSGSAPRFSATDFRMRSSYGVMADWPISLEDLLPYYRRAEQALSISGAPPGGDGDGPGTPLPGARALPAFSLSRMDRAIGPHLEPFGPLPQARPSEAVQGRPACCASATCELCPVDSRFSPLNGLRAVLDHGGLDLRTETVAARLRIDSGSGRVEGIEAIDSSGEDILIRADRYVLAANGFENPAILMRSGLERPSLGRYLFDHAHTTVTVDLRRPIEPGHGNSLSTGLSAAFREGSFRSRRSGAILIPYNPGSSLADLLTPAVLAGESGEDARDGALASWKRRLPLDMLTEDVPQPERRVSLGSDRDSFGLPSIRVAYPPPTEYEEAGIRSAVEGIRRSLAPLGVQGITTEPGPRGGHILGTCRMAVDGDGVVDAEMRHLDLENLHVAGGSAFPTYSPVHPTLTIAALALRLGDSLAR